ncbi:MAG TPA: hypothetical protein VFQ39_12400 [Longimicrobium sp.]|nr:hypothetical protein [Longimicrobium sp.]
MTKLLERAILAVQSLPDTDQDAIAAEILATLEDERRWDASFASSANLLAQLSEEALAEHRAGRTLPLDPEGL